MTEGHFVVGSTLVIVESDDIGRLTARDINEESEWKPTFDQVEEHYVPVSGTAERLVELARQKRKRYEEKRE